MQAVLWATPNPLPTLWNFGLALYPPVAVLYSIGKGFPCYPGYTYVSSLIPRKFPLSVLAVIVRIGAAAFPTR